MNEGRVTYEVIIDTDDDLEVNGKTYLRLLFTGASQDVCEAIVVYLMRAKLTARTDSDYLETMEDQIRLLIDRLEFCGLPPNQCVLGGNQYVAVNNVRKDYDEIFRV